MRHKGVNLRGATLCVMLTIGCNFTCAHCSVGSGPGKLDIRFSRHELLQLISQADEIGVGRVCFTGGEPTVFWEDLMVAISWAYECGMDITLRTNGWWAKSKTRVQIKRIIEVMQNAGLSNLGLSFDKYHAEFITYPSIHTILSVAEELGLPAWLDWTGKESIKEIYGVVNSDMRYIAENKRGACSLRDSGRALSLPDSEFNYYTPECLEYSQCSFGCGNLRHPDIWAYPDGYIAFDCCEGNSRLLFRHSINENGLKQLAQVAEKDEAVLFMHQEGYGGLIRKARAEYPQLLSSYYVHYCDLCCELLPILFPREFEVPEYLRDGSRTT